MAGPPQYPGAPRWVKVSGVVVGVLVLLVIILILAGGGRHGPGRHMSFDDAGGRIPPSGAAEVQMASGSLGGHIPS